MKFNYFIHYILGDKNQEPSEELKCVLIPVDEESQVSVVDLLCSEFSVPKDDVVLKVRRTSAIELTVLINECLLSQLTLSYDEKYDE